MSPHVTYALDRGFLLPTLVSAWSLLTHRPGDVEVLFLFTDEPGPAKAPLDRLAARFPDARITVDRCPAFTAPVPGRARLSAATYARLLLPDLIDHPTLYLDGDTLILRDIGGLFRAACPVAPISAVADPGVQRALRWQAAGKVPANAARILAYLDASAELFDAGRYVNAGVLYYNVPAIRRCGLNHRLADLNAAAHLARSRGHLFDDQSWINVVFAGRTHLLAPEWNAFWGNRMTGKAPFPPPEQETFRASRTDPAIVHFAGKHRPWRMGPWWLHPKRRPWLRLYQRMQAAMRAALGPL